MNGVWDYYTSLDLPCAETHNSKKNQELNVMDHQIDGELMH